jgi:catechol 2,3-dioxygenase-like lactoylglutathione lyase family enzyme
VVSLQAEDETSMAKPNLKQLNGMMWVSSVPAAIEFYSKNLGFEPGFTCEEDGEVTFAIVSRDGIELHLRVCICEDGRHTGNTFLGIEVADGIKLLCDEYSAADVEFVRCLTEEDWGKSFTIADPDKNWLLFTQYSD